MTGNTIPVGKFSGEVCKKGSRDVAVVSSIHPSSEGNGWTLPLGCSMVIASSVHSSSGPGGRRLFGSSGQALGRGTGPVSSKHRQAGTEAGPLGVLDCICHGRWPGRG